MKYSSQTLRGYSVYGGPDISTMEWIFRMGEISHILAIEHNGITGFSDLWKSYKIKVYIYIYIYKYI